MALSDYRLQTTVAFLETGEDDDGNILVECSCADGLKGTFFNTYDFAAKLWLF